MSNHGDNLAIVTKRGVVQLQGETILDAMVLAQGTFGQITWTEIETHQAKGFFQGQVDPSQKRRVAVVNADVIDAMQAFELADWAQGNIA